MKRVMSLFLLLLLTTLFIQCGGGGGSKGSYTENNSISPDVAAPNVKFVQALSDKLVELKFSEDILENTKLEKSNYVISGENRSFVIESIKNGDTDRDVNIVLNDSMKTNENCKLTINNVSDIAGNKIKDNIQLFKGRGVVSVELSNLPKNLTNVDSIEVIVGGEDVVAYQYSIDSNDWETFSDIDKKIELNSINEGIHKIKVVGKDSKGNIQALSEATSFEWTVDKTAPIAVLDNLPNNYSPLKNCEIHVKGLDVVKYKYKLDNGDWSDMSSVNSKIVLSDLVDGEHTISVVAQDFANNLQAESTNYLWNVDTTTPVVVLSNLPDGKTNDKTAIISVSGDKIVSYKYNIFGNWSGEKFVSESNSITFSNLSEGNHTIQVIGKNQAGIWQEISSATTYSWEIDLTPPVASFNLKPSSESSDKNPIITVSGVDVVRYKYKLDEKNWSGLQSVFYSLPISDLTEGSHSVKIVGVDSVGNEQTISSAKSYSWNIDLTAPTFTINNLPANPTNSSNVAITLEGSEVEAYKYKLDDEEWSEKIESNSLNLSDLSESSHTVKIVASDKVGNWTDLSESKNHSWEIDLTPPASVELINLPSSLTNEVSSAITVNGADIVSYKFQLNNGEFSSEFDKNEILSLGGIIEGLNELKIIARDEAGNWMETPLNPNYSWTVDTTAATATLFNQPNVNTNVDSIDIEVGGSDVVKYKYNFNETGLSEEIDISNKIVESGLEEGNYTLKVYGVDSAGNLQVEPTNYSWTVDKTAPTVQLSSLPLDETKIDSIDVSVSGEDVVKYKYEIGGNISGEIDISNKIVESGLTEGSYTLKVYGADISGNWQTEPTLYTWKVDKTAPTPPSASDETDSLSNLLMKIDWSNENDVENVKMQIATDSSFSNVLDEITLGKVSTFSYQINRVNGANYYARVKVSDKVGNWSDYGPATNGLTVVGSVKGMVKDTTGSVISGVTVSLEKNSDGNIVTTSTDGSGNYEFENVEIGTNGYKILFEGSGFQSGSKNNVTVNPGEISNQGIIYLANEGANPGTIKGHVVDANDGLVISGVEVSFLKYDGTVDHTKISDANGNFESEELDSGTYSLKVHKDGFFDLNVDNIVIDGDRDVKEQALCEKLEGIQLRVVVLWGESPKDLDLHVVGPSSADSLNNLFHIYYSQKSFDENSGEYKSGADKLGTFSTASLVQDDTSSYGPEAINLFGYGSGYANGTYTFTVHNWSKKDWYGDSKKVTPTIRIYDSEGLVQEIPFPTGAGEEWYWKAFKINIQGTSRDQRFISVVNQVGTLDYSSVSSMNWEVGGSGVTGYLIGLASGNRMFLTVLLAVVTLLFGLVFTFNRRKFFQAYKD